MFYSTGLHSGTFYTRNYYKGVVFSCLVTIFYLNPSVMFVGMTEAYQSGAPTRVNQLLVSATRGHCYKTSTAVSYEFS
jgi:hypothetical protein